MHQEKVFRDIAGMVADFPEPVGARVREKVVQRATTGYLDLRRHLGSRLQVLVARVQTWQALPLGCWVRHAWWMMTERDYQSVKAVASIQSRHYSSALSSFLSSCFAQYSVWYAPFLDWSPRIDIDIQ